jgi:ABC-2 type transport system ATP-binding protein
MPVLSVDNIFKDYGAVKALKGVSFAVPPGSVFGILGPNGSGKTTLLGIIMDVLKATKGSYLLFDKQPSAEIRKQIGTLLETPNFYHYLSGQKNLEITAEIKGVSPIDIPRVLEIVNLTQRKDSKFSSYSLGMKQRLAIASCLLGNPQVMVFDEPTNGLDPVGIAEIRELIKKLSHQGKTIIMASHLLDEVEKVCTHVAILKKGSLVTTGDVNEILVSEDVVEISSEDNDRLLLILQSLNNYTKVNTDNSVVQLSYVAGTANLTEINKHCFNNGVVLNHLHLKKKSLEAKFFELTNN